MICSCKFFIRDGRLYVRTCETPELNTGIACDGLRYDPPRTVWLCGQDKYISIPLRITNGGCYIYGDHFVGKDGNQVEVTQQRPWFKFAGRYIFDVRE